MHHLGRHFPERMDAFENWLGPHCGRVSKWAEKRMHIWDWCRLYNRSTLGAYLSMQRGGMLAFDWYTSCSGYKAWGGTTLAEKRDALLESLIIADYQEMVLAAGTAQMNTQGGPMGQSIRWGSDRKRRTGIQQNVWQLHLWTTNNDFFKTHHPISGGWVRSKLMILHPCVSLNVMVKEDSFRSWVQYQNQKLTSRNTERIE